MSTGEVPEEVMACSGGWGWQRAPWLPVLPEWHVPPALGVQSLAELSDTPSRALSLGDDSPIQLVARHATHFEA